jgi:hypothetical protein
MMTMGNDDHDDDHGVTIHQIAPFCTFCIFFRAIVFFPRDCVFPPAGLGRRNFDELKALIMDDKVVLKDHDMCFTHKRQCRRIPDPKRTRSRALLELLLAGSSCVDWSLFGKHGGDAGASAAAFIVLILDDK